MRICRWGTNDPNRDLKSLPIAKAMLGGLTALGAPFEVAKWNEGRIVTWESALQEWLVDAQPESKFPMTNEPLSASLSRKTESKSYNARKGRSLSPTT